MTRGEAPHGTPRRYDHGTRTEPPCRCTPCREAKYRTRKGQQLRQLAGQRRMVDPAPARAHVEALVAAGLGVEHIARMSGVARTAIDVLRGLRSSRPPSRRISVRTQARLLAVRADAILDYPGVADDPTVLVPVTGATRRVRAMVVSGRTLRGIAAELGVTHSLVHRIVYARRPQTQLCTVRAIVALSQRWSETPPPQRTARDRQRVKAAQELAARNGWLPFGAWGDIDDPAAEPEPEPDGSPDPEGDTHIVDAVLAERVTWDQMSPADRHVWVVWGVRNGWERAAIARRAGAKPQVVGHYMAAAKAAVHGTTS